MNPGHRADAVQFLIRDRAGQFTDAFDAVFTAEGIHILISPPQAPRANAICEPMTGILRRELPGRLLILNDRHLRQVLTEYLHHYNTARPHRTLGQLPPAQAGMSRPVGRGRRGKEQHGGGFVRAGCALEDVLGSPLPQRAGAMEDLEVEGETNSRDLAVLPGPAAVAPTQPIGGGTGASRPAPAHRSGLHPGAPPWARRRLVG